MNRILAQAITMPGINGQDGKIEYPEQFSGFATRFSSLGSIIQTAIPFIFAAAGIGLLLMIISSGFDLMTSAGDAKKMDTGKQRLTYAILGFIIIFVAYWLVQILGKITGLGEINTLFK